jgi:hypothetical protein
MRLPKFIESFYARHPLKQPALESYLVASDVLREFATYSGHEWLKEASVRKDQCQLETLTKVPEYGFSSLQPMFGGLWDATRLTMYAQPNPWELTSETTTTLLKAYTELFESLPLEMRSTLEREETFQKTIVMCVGRFMSPDEKDLLPSVLEAAAVLWWHSLHI